jgi:hypothetical protein
MVYTDDLSENFRQVPFVDEQGTYLSVGVIVNLLFNFNETLSSFVYFLKYL